MKYWVGPAEKKLFCGKEDPLNPGRNLAETEELIEAQALTAIPIKKKQ